MSEVLAIVDRHPTIFQVKCAGCARKYRTAQPVTTIKKLKACQVCRPQKGNTKPSPFKGMSRSARGKRRP